jgi:hypothetical protein
MMWFPLLTRKKDNAHCVICNKELKKFRYKPRSEWNMVGLLCGDCHIKKTMEYSEDTHQREKQRQHRNEEHELETAKCAVCDGKITSEVEQLKPKWQWNMDSNSMLCKRCFARKDLEYEKRINYCALCGTKMSFFRYNPKPRWRVEGQLCRRCWDTSNARWKNQN